MTFSARDHLETLFSLEAGRIVSTREPQPTQGPAFFLVRSSTEIAWATHQHLDFQTHEAIRGLADSERCKGEFTEAPYHLDAYVRLLGGAVEGGPAYVFPEQLKIDGELVMMDTAAALNVAFGGWSEQEIPERSPIVAVIRDGLPVSVCFSSRSSAKGAEAGVETLSSFRGQGLAGIVTAAWASAIRASGRTPIYSTSWTNEASLKVARKVGLIPTAGYWSFSCSRPVTLRGV